MKVKVAECAALFWDDGRLVWDDYLEHRQHALSPPSEMLARWFASWRELDSAAELGEGYPEIARELVGLGILIEEGSERDALEQRLLERWRPWGASARHFHFHTRTLGGTQFSTNEADIVVMRDRAEATPPPAYAAEDPERLLVPLPPEPAGDDADWPRPRLLEALRARRSTRSFADTALDLGQLATLLELAGGIGAVQELETGAAVFKTSPSAGAWHPVELYVHARRVDGLVPGVYHYAPTREGLERVGDGPASRAELLDAVGGQRWLADAPALVLYTGVIERMMWRYGLGRAYRDVLIGLGHVSQTLFLTATALGLGAVFATAICDEDLERLVGCDPLDEVLLGVAGIGHPAPDA